MRIIDAHHHLWDLAANSYPWLKPETRHPAGDLTPICRSYRLADFLEDARNQNLAKSVHLQAEIDRADPVRETAWLQRVADDPSSDGFPHGIVAFADLADPKVEAVLERHCRYPNIRGIRYLLNYEDGAPLYSATTRGDWLTDRQWRAGYALLEKLGLSFDLQIYWQQMADAADLARAFPNIPLILNHTGMPRSRNPDYVANWRRGMRRLAEAPSIAAKISGLSMFHHDWTAEIIRPFVLDTIEFFGTQGCMFASNFPVDKRATTMRSGGHSMRSRRSSPTPSGVPCSTTTPGAPIVSEPRPSLRRRGAGRRQQPERPCSECVVLSAIGSA
jgi:predicted TIM-barrel fold metal-dependent hydrolase